MYRAVIDSVAFRHPAHGMFVSGKSRRPPISISVPRAALAGLAAFLALYASWLVYQELSGHSRQELGILFLPPIDAAVVLASIWASRHCEDRRLQKFWLLVALAWSVQLCADLILAVYDVGLSEPTFPSLADPFFLAFNPLLLLALLRVPAASGDTSAKTRIALDCALIVVGGGTAIWYFVLGPTIQGGGEGFLATAVSIAYPLGDIAALTALATIVLRRTDPRLRSPLLLIAIGLTMLIVADIVYGYQLLHDTYVPGGPVDVLYVLLAVPFLLAALSQRPMLGDEWNATWGAEERRSPLPFIGMTIGFAILLATQWSDPFFPDLSLLLCAIALAALAGLRQHIAQREQLLTADALSQSESLFRGIYANAGIGIVISAFEGGRSRIVDVNPAFTKMLGYSAEELRGEYFTTLAPRDELGKLDEMRAAIAAGEDTIACEQRCLHKDGSIVWGSLTGSIVRDEDGVPQMLVGAIEDITQRKSAERAKDEFVSIVGHELRTPLTSIRGSLGLLQGGIVGSVHGEAREMIDTAVVNADRLVRLINDVLDLERMESGRMTMEKAPVQAGELVEQSLGVVGAVADAADVELRAWAPDLLVDADSDRIVQTLTNLLANAVKFSQPGQAVSVDVAVKDGRACFTVLDHGRGIPPEQLDSIFERFGQVDPSDAREKGGTGLGLAIAKEIVESHGGRIWAESSPQEGTRIQFTLPLVPSPSLSAQPV